MKDMRAGMRIITLIGVVLTTILLAGCSSDNSDFTGKSRTDQERAFQGDPVKQKEMAEKMKAQYMKDNPNAGKPPANAGTSTGK